MPSINNPSALSPIANASRGGIVLGLYLCLKYLCYMFALPYPILMVLYLLGTVLVPLLSYRLTRAYRARVLEAGIPFSFAMGWVHGTLLYFFGSLLVLIPHYIFYVHLFPDQLPLLSAALEQVYTTTAGSREMITQAVGGDPIDLIRQAMGIPWTQMLLGDLSSNIFWGSVVSVVSALILRHPLSTNK